MARKKLAQIEKLLDLGQEHSEIVYELSETLAEIRKFIKRSRSFAIKDSSSVRELLRRIEKKTAEMRAIVKNIKKVSRKSRRNSFPQRLEKRK